ncbi:YfjI family protein [Schlesneria paludicola]|uniref:YfjI family protein n=1 Tax=Schlesneria paludicola TaxID=360056 RepID=UPI00030418F9|nr:YfjI family protein [Schlesneria paludicola]
MSTVEESSISASHRGAKSIGELGGHSQLSNPGLRTRNSRNSQNTSATSNSVDSVNSVYGSGDWCKPTPLDSGTVPPFPVESLPSSISPFIRDLAEFTQTPNDLGGGMFLAASAIALQGKYRVEIRRGWIEQLSIYIISILEPANRKSAVLARIASPLRRYEERNLQALAQPIRAAKSDHEIKTKLRARLVDDIAKSPSDRDMLLRELQALDEEIAACVIPSEPRVLADDITPECLATRMAQNGGRMGVLAAEGDLFDIMAGRYSKGSANIGIFLRSHSGDEYRVDRGNRPSELIKQPMLSLGFCVQEEVLRGLMGQKGFRGRGLLGRLLYQLPASTLGNRKIDPDEIDPCVEVEYDRVMRSLLEIQPQTTDSGDWIPATLTLSHDAYSEFKKYMIEIEHALGDFGDMATVTDWGGKLVGAVARIAGILHVVKHSERSSIPLEIDAEVMQSAISIGQYFRSHAARAFTVMGRDESFAMAEHILKVIKKNNWDMFTRRGLHQIVRRRVNDPDELDPALKRLVENGYLRQLDQIAQGPGRKPSESFSVNPIVHGMDS